MNSSLILASGSPRRRQLLAQHGYSFEVIPPSDGAECGKCSSESPVELVARLAKQKAEDVAKRYDQGVFLGSDTIVECMGSILGKPANVDHARETLMLLRNRPHTVYTSICLWQRPIDKLLIDVDRTTLTMDDVSDKDLEDYLETDLWEGKAGAFGYQDGLDWVHIVEGSESNVVGLPMELLERMLIGFAPDLLPSS